jgi:hypothetical protein
LTALAISMKLVDDTFVTTSWKFIAFGGLRELR